MTSVLPHPLPGDVGVQRRAGSFHGVTEDVPALQRHQEGARSGGFVQELEAPAVQRVPVVTISMEAEASIAVAKISVLGGSRVGWDIAIKAHVYPSKTNPNLQKKIPHTGDTDSLDRCGS